MPMRVTIAHRLCGIVALLAATHSAAAAQGGPNRPQLDDLVRRLTTADTTAVAALRAHPATALPGDEGILAKAWVDLVDAELRTDSDNRIVGIADRFGRVVQNHGDWGLADLGLARAALLMHGRRIPAPPVYVGVSRGRHFFAYTLYMGLALRDPVQLGAGLDYAASRLAQEGDRLQPTPVTTRLAVLADRPDADPRVALVLARDARTKDDTSAAITWIDRYLARGGDPGVGRLERARMVAMQGRLPDAAHEYDLGLAGTLSTEARALYRRDIAWAAEAGELPAFDSLPAAEVGAFVRRFWAVRDARELRPPGERLQEHLRRWVYAYRNFRVPLAPRRTNVSNLLIDRTRTACLDGPLSMDDIVPRDPSRPDDAREAERVLDHRAILYMRHGPPLRVQVRTESRTAAMDFERESSFIDDRDATAREFQAILPVLQTAPSFDPTMIPVTPGRAREAEASREFRATPQQDQAWLYLMDGVPRIYFLSGSSSLGNDNPGTIYMGVLPDRFAVEQLLQGLPLEPSERRDVLLAAASGRNRYNADQRNYFCQKMGQEWSATLQEDAIVAAGTDTYNRAFEKVVAVTGRAYALGRPAAGDGSLIVAIATDTRMLVPDAADPNRFTVSLDAATIDPRSAVRDQRHGDLKVSVDPKLGTEATAAAVMPLAAGHREVRIQISQGDTRGALVVAEIEPAGLGPGVTASDIVVGEDGSRTTVKVGGRVLPVSPSGVFGAKSTIALYYELYGTVTGQAYKSRLSLRRTDNPKAGAAASVEFTDQGAGDRLPLERRLTLPDIGKGDYQLELTVQDPGGRTVVTRRQAIYVRGN